VNQKSGFRVFVLLLGAFSLWAESAGAMTVLEGSTPELQRLLRELSPPRCFQVSASASSKNLHQETIRLISTEPDSPSPTMFKVDSISNREYASFDDDVRVAFSPTRVAMVMTKLSQIMIDFEPLCAHSIERRFAELEQRMKQLMRRIEKSMAPLIEGNKTLIAFDYETLGVVEGLQLPLLGTMVKRPKSLPSPADFGRRLAQYEEAGSAAAIVHARGGDLAQPRAASRQLNIPLIVLDLQTNPTDDIRFSLYLEQMYSAVLSGIGMSLQPLDSPTIKSELE